MTPTELHALVADVPEVWGPLSYRYGGEWWYDCGYLDPLHAADIICGHTKRMIEVVSVIRHAIDLWSVYTTTDKQEAPTELEAVLAAYRASKAK